MIRVISVVRDFAMYNRLLRDNPCLRGCELVAYDNREDNQPITRRYNHFIDSGKYAPDDWLVFCHEDFEILEPLARRIKSLGLTTDAIYGFAGIDFDGVIHWCMLQSNKDGSNVRVYGDPFRRPKPASTVDCMCIIVHASAVLEHHLRFDERLGFDMYAEDFCIAARERCGLASYVLPIRNQHYSYGVAGKRFLQSYRYVCDKYAQVKTVYFSTTSRRIGRGLFDESIFHFPPMPPLILFGHILLRLDCEGMLWITFRRFTLKVRYAVPADWKRANPHTIGGQQ